MPEATPSTGLGQDDETINDRPPAVPANAVRSIPAPPSADDPLVDLNKAAVNALRDLLQADAALLPAWKAAALSSVAQGVPGDISDLKKLMEGATNATAEEPKS